MNPYINLTYSNKLPFLLRISDTNSLPYDEDNKLYYITSSVWFGGSNDTSLLGTASQTSQSLNISKCNLDIHFTDEFKSYFDKFENLSSYYCLLPRNYSQTIYGLYEVMNAPINGSGFNPKYGLLGSNKSTEERLKLFPKTGDKLVVDIQNRLKELTGRTIEVMVYGDGAFKDPVGHIWELADPVVSPAYTSGLEGTPNEIKLKYVSDNKYADLSGDDLKEAIKDEIKAKDKDLKGKMITQGTTPRRLTDLIGSLCDLTSGSGDKGTPVVFIQGYFDNLADE